MADVWDDDEEDGDTQPASTRETERLRQKHYNVGILWFHADMEMRLSELCERLTEPFETGRLQRELKIRQRRSTAGRF